MRDFLNPSVNVRFYAPTYVFIELFKHNDRLLRATRLTEEELLEALYCLASRLEFVNEANISLGLWMLAHKLCKDVDERDTPYVALTLHLDGCLWTEDIQLKDALSARGFDKFYTP